MHEHENTQLYHMYQYYKQQLEKDPHSPAADFYRSMFEPMHLIIHAEVPLPTVEAKGHDTMALDRIIKDVWRFKTELLQGQTLPDTQAIAVAWTSGKPLDEPIKLTISHNAQTDCQLCAVNDYLYDGFVLQAAEPCTKRDHQIEVEIDVPSGKLVVGNIFDDLLGKVKESEEYDPNAFTCDGIERTVQSHAENGLLHFFVSNTSPSFYQESLTKLAVAESVWCEEGPEEFAAPDEVSGPEVAQICTDLWWVCACDSELAKQTNVDFDQPGTLNVSIDVEPGRYKMTYFPAKGLLSYIDNENDSGGKVFATIEKIS